MQVCIGFNFSKNGNVLVHAHAKGSNMEEVSNPWRKINKSAVENITRREKSLNSLVPVVPNNKKHQHLFHWRTSTAPVRDGIQRPMDCNRYWLSLCKLTAWNPWGVVFLRLCSSSIRFIVGPYLFLALKRCLWSQESTNKQQRQKIVLWMDAYFWCARPRPNACARLYRGCSLCHECLGRGRKKRARVGNKSFS